MTYKSLVDPKVNKKSQKSSRSVELIGFIQFITYERCCIQFPSLFTKQKYVFNIYRNKIKTNFKFQTSINNLKVNDCFENLFSKKVQMNILGNVITQIFHIIRVNFLLVDFERSDECIDFTMTCMLQFQTLRVVSDVKVNILGGKSKHFTTVFKNIEKNKVNKKKKILKKATSKQNYSAYSEYEFKNTVCYLSIKFSRQLSGGDTTSSFLVSPCLPYRCNIIIKIRVDSIYSLAENKQKKKRQAGQIILLRMVVGSYNNDAYPSMLSYNSEKQFRLQACCQQTIINIGQFGQNCQKKRIFLPILHFLRLHYSKK
ncbi:hypothetical protein AGLY_006587 [Aphis glycines]|uniref:Uncharacterized protein n=1 Tax=Aphis glycines TaxID=307491 RepID=A0A6G0TRK6_APHGL|nr:hypothetical protein AGLY_006587 [Aphis glycines]